MALISCFVSLGYFLSHVFYSELFLYVMFSGSISCENDISTFFLTAKKKFVTQLNLKNNVDDDDDNN